VAIHEDVLRELQWDTCVEEADVSIALNRQPDASDVELVATIAHDLRQPLMIVRASAQLLRRRAQAAGAVSAAWLDQSLTQIEEAGLWVEQLIDDLVDLARIRVGTPLLLSRQPNDLVVLAAQVVADAHAISDRHRVRIELDESSVIGRWDAMCLRRVLENVLSNALKYSPPGREIVVRVGQDLLDGTWAVLMVRDHGRGIPEADQPHIFEPFWRGSNVDQVAGSGLGLASVKWIVEAHGGRIALTSGEGEGTTVTVRLPRE
jgi:signal transduction histidine kinase